MLADFDHSMVVQACVSSVVGTEREPSVDGVMRYLVQIALDVPASPWSCGELLGARSDLAVSAVGFKGDLGKDLPRHAVHVLDVIGIGPLLILINLSKHCVETYAVIETINLIVEDPLDAARAKHSGDDGQGAGDTIKVAHDSDVDGKADLVEEVDYVVNVNVALRIGAIGKFLIPVLVVYVYITSDTLNLAHQKAHVVLNLKMSPSDLLATKNINMNLLGMSESDPIVATDKVGGLVHSVADGATSIREHYVIRGVNAIVAMAGSANRLTAGTNTLEMSESANNVVMAYAPVTCGTHKLGVANNSCPQVNHVHSHEVQLRVHFTNIIDRWLEEWLPFWMW